MKKIKIFAMLSLIILSMFSLVACGENGGPSNNQNTEWSTIKEATCTEEGLKEKYVNGELIQDVIPVLGHDYSKWNVILKETCTTDGKEERVCSRCSLKEEKVIEAHHVLKDGYSFDIDTHYYECENCTDKIDLSNHNFEINKEDKFAYFLDDNVYDGINKIKIGCVNILLCYDCNIKIVDCNLISKYFYYNAEYYYLSEYYIDLFGMETDKYNIQYGYLIDTNADYINFEYDSNYNLVSVTYEYSNLDSDNQKVEYTYNYNDNMVLEEIVVSHDDYKNPFHMSFKYQDGYISNIFTSNGDFDLNSYDYDIDGNLSKKTIYVNSNVNGEVKRLVESEHYYIKGFVSEEYYYSYVDGELSENTLKREYNYTYNPNGNILEITSFDIRNELSQKRSCVSFTYNNEDKIISFIYDGDGFNKNLSFEYSDDKLSKMISSSNSVNYRYADNKISAYDSLNNLVVEIEYISDYKIIE